MVQVVGRPQVEWMGVLQETYKGMVNLATLGAIMAYVQDQVSTAWFSHLFQWLAIVSIIPAAIASLLGPIISFIQGVKICLFTCSGLFTGLGSAGGAAAMVTAVVRGDDGMQDRALYALEGDDDDKPADKHQQLAPPSTNGNPNGYPNGYPNGNGNRCPNGNGNGSGNGSYWNGPSGQVGPPAPSPPSHVRSQVAFAMPPDRRGQYYM